MTTLTETFHAGGFMVSEAAGLRSRESVTVLSGQNLKAGAVVARHLGAATPAAFAGNTGNGAMGAVTVLADAKPGVYKLVIIEPATNAGRFTLTDPDGVVVGVGTVAVAFAGPQLSFTLADGATDFAAGDGFDITVADGGKVKEYNPATAAGGARAYGVLWDDVDASASDKPGVALVRDAEVNGSELVWFAGATAQQIIDGKASLALRGIIAR
jgi:Bacteriophage lambda head decoration protein D